MSTAVADNQPLPSQTSAHESRRFRLSGLDWKNLTASSEGEMARNRVVISLLIWSYFVAEWVLQGRFLALPMLTISTFFAFSICMAVHILRSPEPSHVRRLLAICADIGTLSFGLYIGGEVTACTWPVYLWVIYGNGFRFGQRYLGLATVTSAVCFAAVLAFTPYWADFYNLSLGLLFGLVVLPIYASKLIKDLSVARQRAEEANKTKSLFLASVSHELRTPLNAIVGLSDCLTATRLNHEQSDMLSTINRSGRTLSHLIDNILDYSRLESGAMPCNVKDVNLPSLVADICALGHTQVKGKDVSFNLHLSSDVPIQVETDELKLVQILTNFTSNAIKFTEQGNVTLFISSRALDSKTSLLRFAVRDTGIGISEDAQDRVFERFTQENEKIVDQYGGTGLGLAIVKQTAQLLGGDVGVESVQGCGSTFWCEIPVSTPAAATPNLQSAHFAFFVGEDMATSVKQQAWNFGDTVFLHDHDELLASCEQARRDGKDNLLFTDAETHEVVADWLKTRGDKIAHVIRLAAPDEPADALDRIQKTSIARIPVDSSERYVRSVTGWVEDVCYRKRQNSEKLQLSVTPASILIAEDNPANQLVIRKIMTNAGHDFKIVGDGEGVMAALAEKKYDVILLDLNMPVMNGFETIKFIRFALHDENVPVIAVTADATSDTAEKCREATFDAVVTKPYRAHALLATIAEYTEDLNKSPTAETDEPNVARLMELEVEPSKSRSYAAPELSYNVLDYEQLEELESFGPPEFFKTVIHTFVSECQKKIVELKSSANGDKQAEVCRLAHALKSSALNIGAARIAQICQELEDHAETADLSWTQEEVGDLEMEIELCKVELLDYLEQVMQREQPELAVSYH